MSTQINITIDQSDLKGKVKQLRDQNRLALLEKERLADLEERTLNENKKKNTKPEKSKPITGEFNPLLDLEEPATLYTPPGGVVAVQVAIPANYNANDPSVLVGPPGVTANEKIGATASLQKIDLNPTPPGFGFPISGYGYASSSGIYSDWYLLPLTKETCIAVQIRTQVSAWYYFQFTGAFTLLDSDSDSYWQANAFVVSKTKARQIEVPTALEDNLKQLFPPMTLNKTQQYTGNPFFIPSYTPYPIQVFDSQIWRNSSRYGNYTRENETLSVTFGMGTLESSHGGKLATSGRSEFLTPAVYQFITGPMTINNSNKNYAYMRSTYFPTAPSQYLSRCQLDGTCDSTKVGFDVTRQAPVDINTPMTDGVFGKKKAYDVALNGASINDNLYYSWNWDRANYCRQLAGALGFSASDFKP